MSTMPRSNGPSEKQPSAGNIGLLIFSWLFVGAPLAFGVYQTILKSMALFH
jgi:hypothetical protein